MFNMMTIEISIHISVYTKHYHGNNQRNWSDAIE